MLKKSSFKAFSLLLLLAVVIYLSLSVGYSRSSLTDLAQLLVGQGDQAQNFIITSIRLPRVLACLIGGGSLALAGSLLQTLTRNPLADSGILGINAGAGLVMTIMIGLATDSSIETTSSLPIFAMLGGAGAILSLSHVPAEKPQHQSQLPDYHRCRGLQHAFRDNGRHSQPDR